jgi:hypothetical protein
MVNGLRKRILSLFVVNSYMNYTSDSEEVLCKLKFLVQQFYVTKNVSELLESSCVDFYCLVGFNLLQNKQKSKFKIYTLKFT